MVTEKPPVIEYWGQIVQNLMKIRLKGHGWPGVQTLSSLQLRVRFGTSGQSSSVSQAGTQTLVAMGVSQQVHPIEPAGH